MTTNNYTPSFQDCSVVLNTIIKQATGENTLTPIDTSSFVSLARRALGSGYDPLSTAISQVLSRTIFSIRPYSAKFKGLKKDSAKYGAWNRKLTPADKDFEKDNRLNNAAGTAYADGDTMDQYKINKPVVLETQISGGATYQKSMTVWRDQLDSAFNSLDGFQNFLGMMMQNASDMIEQAHEDTARMLIASLIVSDLVEVSTVEGHAINVLEKYNAETGKSLKVADVYKPENIEGFTKYFYELVNNTSQLMTERSQLYQNEIYATKVSDSNYQDKYRIIRHTPVNKQKLYILAPFINKVKTNVFASIFNPDFLKLIDFETVNFWQSIGSPDSVSVTTSYLAPDGKTARTTATKENILGVLFDEEAAGYTTINEWAQATPFNARGGYYNQFWHFTDRYWFDQTEKSVVFYMKDASE